MVKCSCSSCSCSSCSCSSCSCSSCSCSCSCEPLHGRHLGRNTPVDEEIAPLAYLFRV
jgi:hypothetical protein